MKNEKDIQAFFLEAVQRTYAADAPKASIADLPGSKVLRYERGDLLYVDYWFSSRKKSSGQTVIWFQNRPVWCIQYHGSWAGDDPRVIPFLKRALLSQITFNGGRGPFRYDEGALTYRNFPVKKDFADFRGEEEIHEGSKLLFSQAYSGMML